MWEFAKLFFQIMLRAVPPLMEERKRRREIGLSNDALELAVLKHEDEIEGLPIQKIIAIGAKK